MGLTSFLVVHYCLKRFLRKNTKELVCSIHTSVSRKRNPIVITRTKKILEYSEIIIAIQSNVRKEDKPGKLKTHTKEGQVISANVKNLH